MTIIRCLPLLAILAINGCSERRTTASVSSRTIHVMGTEAVVTLPANDAKRLDDAADRVEAVFREKDARLSLYRDESELSAVNRQAGIAPLQVSPDTLANLIMAFTFARETGGAFDPTVAPLVAIWRHAQPSKEFEAPTPETIARALELVGHEKVLLDTEEGTVMLLREGMQLDLGGIAKGTAVDRAATVLKEAGYDRFLIDLGGDIRCEGAPDGQTAWRIGVRNPFDKRQMLGVVRMVSQSAIATSGNYERFIEIDGERYGHIIDPRTGYPVKGMAGVTVTAGDAGVADAMSTALFVDGMQGAPALLAGMPGIDAMLVPDRQPMEIWITPGFKAMFEPLPEYRDVVRVLRPDAVP